MPTWRVLVGDVREMLAELPDQSVQMVCTSPPYWGLRDYGTATWDGGDPACAHRKGEAVAKDSRSTLVGTTTTQNHSQESWGDSCRKCGARRIDSQIGLEPTPDAYVQALVQVFQSVWRVLKDDGVCWLNLGDSYVSNGRYESDRSEYVGDLSKYDHRDPRVGARLVNLKPKDLCGIPWRVAFALQADGWYLRSDIIWAKPNPMPESVTDRPTKAHEYIFLLSKSERYFYDADAINEPIAAYCADRIRHEAARGMCGDVSDKYQDVRGDAGLAKKQVGARLHLLDGGRNCRSVWTITTQPYPEAHFATFPEALPERCIKAGSRLGDTVLDPFCGSGTTGQVAIQLGRNFIGVELNPTYAELARTRIGGAAPLFAQESA